MLITETFYPQSRAELRNWLEINHQIKSEIWLHTYRKASGKYALPYDDLVEECLCFGWIDGIKKKWDEDGSVQRITPRRKKTYLSELNRQRFWKLQHLGLMTPAGIRPIESQIGSPDDPLVIPEWVLSQLQANPAIWATFNGCSHFYKRLKIGWIAEVASQRREEAQKRLNYLIKMTALGKQYGAQPLSDDFFKNKK